MGRTLQQIAQLIKADVGLEVAFADVGGWDTHVNEIGRTPPPANSRIGWRTSAQALAAFHQDLGDRMADVTVVTMSEFGRTAKENGNRGTDHGHANVMFAIGGNIRGGKVYGDWPGLAPEQPVRRPRPRRHHRFPRRARRTGRAPLGQHESGAGVSWLRNAEVQRTTRLVDCL